eukprot:CAMPEP_0170561610 /NCGR_PEP_ID=MMETSP0211-20121228/55792_1 /TAXON_ID=311385 /ORGANISM="Pseudokeronopsis sp., Strain OXSARD2" /LENGTH=94 /DNA_ID=CAMNT_0010877375 /DNA_START=215 /DNA_END=496 /DNA_ORIENTATION=+
MRDHKQLLQEQERVFGVVGTEVIDLSLDKLGKLIAQVLLKELIVELVQHPQLVNCFILCFPIITLGSCQKISKDGIQSDHLPIGIRSIQGEVDQ